LFAPLDVPNRTTAGSSFGHLIAILQQIMSPEGRIARCPRRSIHFISSLVTYVGGSISHVLHAHDGPGWVSETRCYALNRLDGKLSAQASSYNGQPQRPSLAGVVAALRCSAWYSNGSCRKGQAITAVRLLFRPPGVQSIADLVFGLWIL
jgi:hypothetical protein